MSNFLDVDDSLLAKNLLLPSFASSSEVISDFVLFEFVRGELLIKRSNGIINDCGFN
jgi:hypothetical protein